MYSNHDNQKSATVAKTVRMAMGDQEKSRAMALVVRDLPPSTGRAVWRMVDALHGGGRIHTAFLTRASAAFLAAEGELDKRTLGEVVSAPSLRPVHHRRLAGAHASEKLVEKVATHQPLRVPQRPTIQKRIGLLVHTCKFGTFKRAGISNECT